MKMKNSISISADVEIFKNVSSPWIYVPVPAEYSEMLSDLADRGLIPVKVTLGASSWNTSMMPMGDGTHFIPLSKKIRTKESISVGDHVILDFTPR